MNGSIIIFIGAATVCLASAVPVEDTSKYVLNRTYPRFIKFPDGEGNLHDVDLEAEPDWEYVNEITRNPNNNHYYLYTWQNPRYGQPLTLYNINSISASNFNPNAPTVVIAHGWMSDRFSSINPTIRDAFLSTHHDINIIVMDWSRLANSPNYPGAVAGVPAVGRGLGEFLAWLSYSTGASLSNMHLVGFSLGAHLVGNAGRYLGGKVARITGLDPAGPWWHNNDQRLRPSDAVYTEAIHTDGGRWIGGLGIGLAIADVDFFPNGGTSQPGCLINTCNHSRAWQLFAATVTYNHLVGRRCFSDTDFSWSNCGGDEVYMGNAHLPKTGSGVYRVDTGRRYPF